ncbi:hypothetical protein ACTSKR_00805 [Chitinibacteraceae bacterium HSL-7]
MKTLQSLIACAALMTLGSAFAADVVTDPVKAQATHSTSKHKKSAHHTVKVAPAPEQK